VGGFSLGNERRPHSSPSLSVPLFLLWISPLLLKRTDAKSCISQKANLSFVLPSSLVPCCDGPAFHIILDCQLEPVNLPKVIQGPRRTSCLAVSRAYASFPCVFLGSPDARRQVAALGVG
jgi:hypothetical protein